MLWGKAVMQLRHNKITMERNPELYAKLYSIQQNAKATDSGKKEDGISSMIIQSEKGELGLAVQKSKWMARRFSLRFAMVK